MGFKDMLKRQKDTFEDDQEYGYEEGYEEGYEDEEDTNSSFGGAGTLELKVVRPENFESAPQIAEHLLNNRTVVLNLEATNKETARRLIDFLSGVAYSIDGSIRRVANNTFVITPHNVDVTGETLKEGTRKPAATDTDDFAF